VGISVYVVFVLNDVVLLSASSDCDKHRQQVYR